MLCMARPCLCRVAGAGVPKKVVFEVEFLWARIRELEDELYKKNSAMRLASIPKSTQRCCCNDEKPECYERLVEVNELLRRDNERLRVQFETVVTAVRHGLVKIGDDH